MTRLSLNSDELVERTGYASKSFSVLMTEREGEDEVSCVMKAVELSILDIRREAPEIPKLMVRTCFGAQRNG